MFSQFIWQANRSLLSFSLRLLSGSPWISINRLTSMRSVHYASLISEGGCAFKVAWRFKRFDKVGRMAVVVGLLGSEDLLVVGVVEKAGGGHFIPILLILLRHLYRSINPLPFNKLRNLIIIHNRWNLPHRHHRLRSICVPVPQSFWSYRLRFEFENLHEIPLRVILTFERPIGVVALGFQQDRSLGLDKLWFDA